LGVAPASAEPSRFRDSRAGLAENVHGCGQPPEAGRIARRGAGADPEADRIRRWPVTAAVLAGGPATQDPAAQRGRRP